MKTKSKIVGVSGGAIQMRSNTERTIATQASRKMNMGTPITAMAGGGLGGNIPVSTASAWASEYQYMMTGLIPADPQINDPAALALFYRDIYLLDHTAGSAIDIQSSFPFSDFDLRGLEDKELAPFKEAVERLNIRRMMPEISTAYLVDGFFCGSLIFDPVEKQFIDTMIHDALQCSVKYSPFYNVDPEINVKVGIAVQNFLSGGSSYNKRYIETLPPAFVELLMQGSFTLDPVATLFVPRKSLTDRSYVSYLHRILPMYLIEKTMYRGTLTEAHRRQRAMTHLTAGDDNWVPTAEELAVIVQQFQMAEYDPLGGWISTRNSVQATDIRPGGDFWKWTDMSDIMVSYKLRALGISESFLSGDASYASAESAYSAFLETQDAYRGFLTDRVFYQKIFPLIAVVNNLYKDPKGKKANDSVVDFLFNASARSNLKIPELHWHKQLETDHEEGVYEMLEKLDERGIPVPIKAWVAAAGQDFDSLLRDLEEDSELRRKLEAFTGKDTSHDQDGSLPEDFGDITEANLTTLSIANGGRRRMNLLERNFGDGLVYSTNKSGSQRKHVYDQVGARKRSNDNIIKAQRALADKEHREYVRRKNLATRGTDVIAGAGDLPDKSSKHSAGSEVIGNSRKRSKRRFF